MPDAIGVIGAGLIGASIIARVRAVWPSARILVVEQSAVHREQVRARFPDVHFAMEGSELRTCDIVFICTPVSAIAGLVEALLRDTPLDSGPVVVDTGSVKASVAGAVAGAGFDASRYVPGHPLAGSHQSGPLAGSADIIDGRAFILAPTRSTSEAALETARGALEALGARVVLTTPDLHDDMLALTSHLPHVIAYALAESFCAAADRAGRDVSGLIAGSFRAQTIFAASDPEMWADILIANSAAIRTAADDFNRRVNELGLLAEAGDKQAIMARIAAIRDRRKAIGD